MTEFKLTIEAPELANAITALADAIANRPLTATAEKPATRTRTKKNAETPAAPAAIQPAEQPVPTQDNSNAAAASTAPTQLPQQAAPAPVIPYPVQAAVAPATAPQPAPVAIPSPAPAQPAAPVQTPQPAPVAPAAPTFTPEMIANAGANLLERGLMPQLMGLLQKFGVQAVTQLRQDQYPAFAAELRALGANI